MGPPLIEKVLPLVETTNALEPSIFRSEYLFGRASGESLSIGIGKNLVEYRITLEYASTLSLADFEVCFDLIEASSSADYANSTTRWSPTKKRKEMRLPDLRYLLVKRANIEANHVPVEGFLSFMITYEDGYEVVYCYEIHLDQHLRGWGVGKRLMFIMEDVGLKIGVKKAMLSVFLHNTSALKFYERLGYEEDNYSPQPKKLRRGVIKIPDYVILSKELTRIVRIDSTVLKIE